jgi:PKD repeat protein
MKPKPSLSKKFLVLIFIFMICYSKVYSQITLTDPNLGSNSFSLCNGVGDFTLHIETTSLSLPVCTLCINNLDPGFIISSINNIPLVDITPCGGCGNLCFEIDPVTYNYPGTSLDIIFHIIGNCALTNNNATYSYPIDYTLTWDNGASSTTAHTDFTVRFPKLSVTQADPVSNINNQTVQQRIIKITNIGNEIYDPSNGSYGPFTITDFHDLGPNAGAITAGPFRDFNNVSLGGVDVLNICSLTIGQAELDQILLAEYSTALHQLDFTGPYSTFTIYEDIIGNGCFQAPAFVNSSIEADWSCNTNPCQHSELPAQNTSLMPHPRLFLHPNLPQGYYGTYDACYGETNVSPQQLVIRNWNVPESAPATDIHVTLEKDVSVASYTDILGIQPFLVFDNTTDITGQITVISTAGINNPATACDNVAYPIKWDITVMPPLLPGHNLTIQWNVRNCCPQNQTCADPVARKDFWNYTFSYSGFCDGHTESLLQPAPVEDNAFSGMPNDFTYDGPVTIDVDELNPLNITYPVSLGLITVPVWQGDPNSQEFVFHVTLGPNLTFVNTANIFLSGPNLVGNIFPLVCYDGPFAFGVIEDVRLIYSFPQIGNDVANLNGSELHFEMYGECPDGIGPNFVDIELYHIPDNDACIPGQSCTTISYPVACGLPTTGTALLISCLQVPLTFHCPGCKRQGIHSLGYQIQRQTYGFEDRNNNGGWDAGGPVQITTANVAANPGVKQKRVMVGDEFQGTLKTKIVKNPNYGPPPGSMGPWLYGYWRAGFDAACNSNLQVVDMEPLIPGDQAIMHIVTLPGGPPLHSDIPINLIPGLTPVTCENPIANEFYYDFSISVLQTNWAIKYPGDPFPLDLLEFKDGTVADFIHTMRQVGNVCAAIVPCENNNTIYLGLRPEVLGVNELVDPDLLGLTSIADYTNYCSGQMAGINYCGYTTATCQDFQWYCTHQGDVYNQVGYQLGLGINFDATVWGNDCGYGVAGSKGLNIGNGIYTAPGNNFPFEYRHWNHIDKLVITLPQGYHFGGSAWQEWSNAGYIFINPWTCGPTFTQAGNQATFDYTNDLFNDGDESGALPNILMDDGYTIWQRFGIIPDCSAEGPATVTFTVTDYFADQMGTALSGCGILGPDENANQPGIQITTPIALPISPDRIRPQLQLNANTANGVNHRTCWDVLLTNVAPSAGANAYNQWIAFDWLSSSAAMQAGGVVIMEYMGQALVDGSGNVPGTYLPNHLYYIPNGGVMLEPGNTITIQICTKYECSLPADYLNIFSGYNCFPDYDTQDNLCGVPLPEFNTVQDYTNYNCNAASTQLVVHPQNPDLNICINNGCVGGNPVNAAFCSDVTYTVNIQNVGFSGASGIIAVIDWPAIGGYFVSASVDYNGTIVTLSPSANQLVVDINAIAAFSSIHQDGLPGFQQLIIDGALNPQAESTIIITYTFHIDCNFSYSQADNMHIFVTANPADCPKNVPYHNFVNPILDSPNSQFDLLSTDVQIMPFTGCDNTTQGTITITNLTNHISNGNNNFLFLNMPVGFTATNFSINPQGAPLYHWLPGDLVNIPDISTSPGNVRTITFDLQYDGTVPCGLYEIRSHIVAIDNIFCGSTLCNSVNLVESEDVFQVDVPEPDATFYTDPTTICLGEITTFIPNNPCQSVNPMFHLWHFSDDNSFYTNVNPQHVFTQQGTFFVDHWISANQSPSACVGFAHQEVTVKACGCHINADFTWQVSSRPPNPCTIEFTSFIYSPNITPLVYHWYFGDGGISSLPNPSHTYVQSGLYQVCVNIKGMDQYGMTCDTTICHWIIVTGCSKEPCLIRTDFTYNKFGCWVLFTDQTLHNGTIISWLWDFDDPASGINNQSSLQNPVHQFVTPGIHNVCLTVKVNYLGSICEEKICHPVEIKEGCGKDCELSCDFKIKVENCRVYLNGFSSGGPIPTEWYWDFGDGYHSNQQNPAHTFNHPGTYHVCMTVVVYFDDRECLCQRCYDIKIADDCLPGACNVSCLFKIQVQGCTVTLSDHSTSLNNTTIFDWAWDFGDGASALHTDFVTHTYAIPGTYIVTLTVYGTNGITICTSQYQYEITTDDCDPGHKESSNEKNEAEVDLSVIPNPNDGNFILSIDMHAATNAEVCIVDPAGRCLNRRNIKINFGVNNLEYNLSDFAKGVYFIHLISDKKIQALKLVIN